MEKNNQTRKTSLNLDEDLFHKFKLHCIKNKVKMGDELNDIIKERLRRKE